MSWKLDHVAVPAHNVRTSAAFYTEIIGLRESTPRPGPEYVAGRDIARFEAPDGCQLHLAKPEPAVARSRGSFIDPLLRGHVGVAVTDLDAVKAELVKRGWYFTDEDAWRVQGHRRIYVLDPSTTCIEINQKD